MRRVMLPATLLVLFLAIMLLVGSALLRPATSTTSSSNARIAQIDTSNYPEVTLYVAVQDATGAPLAGLTSNDFAVREDGVPVDLRAFGGAGSDPIASVLVLDRSGSMGDDNKLIGAREAALAFVSLLRPGDQAALIAFNDEVRLQHEFTSDQASLNRAIERVSATGGTALYDAVAAGVDLLREQEGRHLLIVLSDGQDCREPTNSCPADAGSQTSLTEALALAEAANQPVAVIGLGARASTGRDGIDERVLQQLADQTGGVYLYAPRSSDLVQLYANLAGEVQQEYRLTYLSPRPFYDGTRRDITIQVGADQLSAGYTERHLINVVSNPVVGLILLTPLAALLILPGLQARRRKRRVLDPAPQPEPELPLDRPHAPASVASPSVPVPLPVAPAAPATSVQPVATRQCVNCAASLRPTARFCAACGTAQPDPTPPRRTFCDMCGRPLLPDTQFCMECGEPVRRQ
ncbi:MAG: VWA domain-containing protein [Oscillochloridaceae bacterium umkhey_bin13]